MAAHQAPRPWDSPGQEYWSGSPFPSLMHESEKWKWQRHCLPLGLEWKLTFSSLVATAEFSKFEALNNINSWWFVFKCSSPIHAKSFFLSWCLPHYVVSTHQNYIKNFKVPDSLNCSSSPPTILKTWIHGLSLFPAGKKLPSLYFSLRFLSPCELFSQ